MYCNKSHNNKVSGYSEAIPGPVTGNIITVTVDTIQGVLRFAVNGRELGECFRVPELLTTDVYPALSLYYPGDSVEIYRK